MNNKFRELAKDAAGTRKHVPPLWQFYDEELEKFAESLVRECAEVARQHNLQLAERSYMVHKHIQEHFGIE